MDRPTIGAIAGMAGSILFVATFTIEGSLRSGYDWRYMYVSELALGPRGVVQIVNFVVAGVLTMLFARGLATEFPAARAGVVAIRLVGFGLVGGGASVMDPLTTPFRTRHWHGHLHAVFGALIMYGMLIGPFLFAREFRRDRRWRPLARGPPPAAAVTLVLTLVLPVVVELQRTGATTTLPGGAIHRTHHIVYFVWQVVVAARLLR